MNERIKDFLEQAHTYSFQENRGQFVLDDFAEKFAVLIIQECYNVIIKSQHGHFNPETSWNACKQNFGVKE